MKIKLCVTSILVAACCMNSVSHAGFDARLVDIDRFLEKSDLIVIGSVLTRTIMFTGESDVLGNYHRVKVDKVLYIESEIAEAIFAANDLKRINADLKREPPEHIYVFGLPLHVVMRGPMKNAIGSSMSDPTYFQDTEYLFFFKISDLPEKYPDSYLYDPGKSESQGMTPVSSLDEPLFFEAAVPTRDSTRNLKNKRQSKWLPYVETLTEALSIPNQKQKEKRLRQLADADDSTLAQIAGTTLLRVSPTEQARVRARMMERAQEETSRE
ncbi:MAG: hypothetical protein OXN17_18790 [Candidatus Poribacteria bacterium]|nr:hypothetical protein [Candidatus Poribacteria bacterium]MDE0506051.1 hypothetical protein [Candidatus Poribacteria bacterium]